MKNFKTFNVELRFINDTKISIDDVYNIVEDDDTFKFYLFYDPRKEITVMKSNVILFIKTFKEEMINNEQNN